MTTYTCPKGHESSEADFCDECGAKIGGTGVTPVPSAPTSGPSSGPVAAPVAAPAGGQPCPNCGTPRAGSSRFCEDCGFDHTTGKVPTLTVPVPASPGTGGGTPAGSWTATIRADRKYFEDNAIEGVEFPADPGERRVTLPSPQARIGRRSASKGTNPEIDLADTDPGTSHSHALLTLSVDGTWLVSDLGSTNGTYVNDEQSPLTAGQTRALKDGDEVHVGAWTTITLHAPAS
ncbi:FHA domain-containing protein [Actinoplanes sp. NPDC051411]|uniref:FHA domain-containing protein n=1 Tax=Actinoplanes sp. NPDC051411 TaxID=3155522 RepID=UPI0034182D7D